MNNKLWAILGGVYAAFAILTFMAAVDSNNPVVANPSQNVANSSSTNHRSGQRLYQSNPRKDYWLTIWTIQGCYACKQQKKEVPALRKAGYNVVVREVYLPKKIKLFPTTVVTKGKLNGERVTTVEGFKTVKDFDTILKIRDDPKEPDEPDYHIYWVGVSVVAVIDTGPYGDRQVQELIRLKKYGINVKIHRRRTGIPTIVLVDYRQNVVVAVWRRFVTAEEIVAALR